MPFGFNIPFGRKPDGIEISSINLKWKGKMHALPGLKSQTSKFKVTIPFANKAEGKSVIPGLKLQEKGEETITAVEVSQPFKLDGVTPQLPITIERGNKVEIVVDIEGPDFAYSGPLGITFGSKAVENVKVEITKQLVDYSGVKTDIPNTAEIMVLQKGVIFKKDIQLLKALSFGSEVTAMSVNEPFKLVSTDPKAPFKISDGNSWIVALYIQAPDFSYSGPLELSIK